MVISEQSLELLAQSARERATTLAHSEQWRKEVISHLDLTSLNHLDSASDIQSLCQKAHEHNVAAVCVYPTFVSKCREALLESSVPVATVAGAFPHGLAMANDRLSEIRACAGIADEVDTVIPRRLVVHEHWSAFEAEMNAQVEACDGTLLKVIFSISELENPSLILNAGSIACAAGVQFLKTSTGKEPSPATLEQGAALLLAIRQHVESSGIPVGFKAAGGVRTPDQAAAWWCLVEDVLGSAWLTPDLFRIGASGLLDTLLG